MKTLLLKDTDIKNGSSFVGYVDLIRTIINVPRDERNGGLTTEVMRKNLRVLKALDEVKEGVLTLEDADATHLQNLVKSFDGWGVNSQSIVSFEDEVLAMK